MRPLHLVPPLMEHEPIQSFVSRVARRHGVDMPTFCAELGLQVHGVVAGEDGAVRRLSDLTGVDAGTLSRRAFRPCGGTWLFADQVLHRQSVRRIDLAVCPLCLRNDVAAPGGDLVSAHVRVHWLVKAVRTCTTHGVPLVRAVDGRSQLTSDRYHDLAARVAPTLGRLDQLVGEARPDAATRLEGWITRRLAGDQAPAVELLEAMPLFATVRSCEMLGVAALFGPRMALRSLGDADWRAAGEVGFDVASLGAEAVSSCLIDILRHHGVSNRNMGPTKAFGALYGWLRSEESGPVYEPFRAILRRVVMDTIPLPAGSEVLGVALDRRRVHSLRSAGAEVGRSMKDMRRELRAGGVLPFADGKGPGRLVPVTPEEAEAARVGAVDSVPRSEAASLIGATAADVRRLLIAGLLGPRASETSQRRHTRFSRRSLTTFMDRLLARVTDALPPGADMCDIPTAASRSLRSLAAITTMVMEGGLRNVGRALGGHGFRSLRVDLNEIRSLAERDRSTQRSINDVTAELRVTRVTALALVKDGYLPAARVTSPLSRRTTLVVEASALAAFASTFVSLATLAGRRGLAAVTLRAKLDASGVVPAFEGGRTRSVIYRVADVDRGSGAAPLP